MVPIIRNDRWAPVASRALLVIHPLLFAVVYLGALEAKLLSLPMWRHPVRMPVGSPNLDSWLPVQRSRQRRTFGHRLHRRKRNKFLDARRPGPCLLHSQQQASADGRGASKDLARLPVRPRQRQPLSRPRRDGLVAGVPQTNAKALWTSTRQEKGHSQQSPPEHDFEWALLAPPGDPAHANKEMLAIVMPRTADGCSGNARPILVTGDAESSGPLALLACPRTSGKVDARFRRKKTAANCHGDMTNIVGVLTACDQPRGCLSCGGRGR